MTVIAAYQSFGRPMLIGDALTSNQTLATRGLRKKIYLIGPNLVLGWTGYLSSAEKIVPSIFKRFYGRPVSEEEWKAFLTSYRVEELNGLLVMIVGWLVDKSPLCFLWRSDYAGVVFDSDRYFVGTGGQFFQDAIDDVRLQSTGSNVPTSTTDYAVLDAVTHAGEAFFDQTLYSANWGETDFGFSYEILAWTEGRFQAVHSVLCVGWDYQWNAAEKRGWAEPAPFMAKFVHYGNWSLVQRTIHSNFRIKETTNYLVRPVYDLEINPDVLQSTTTLDSHWYLHCFVLRPHTPRLKLCLAATSVDASQSVSIDLEAEVPSFKVDTEYLDQAFIEAGA